jgi:hypothetical protein
LCLNEYFIHHGLDGGDGSIKKCFVHNDVESPLLPVATILPVYPAIVLLNGEFS